MKPLKLKENFSKTSKAHTAPLFLAFCLVILPFPLLSGEFGGKLRGKHETRGCVATTTVQPLPYDCFHGVTWKLFTAVENNYRSVDVQPTAECAVGKWSKLIWAACFGLIWQSLQTLQVILYFTLVKGKYGRCWCQQKKAWQFSAALRSHRYGLVQNNTSVVRISTGVVLENPQSPLRPEASWKGWKDSSIHCWNLHCCKQVGTHAQTQICKKESKKQNEQIEIGFRREFWSTTCPNADWPWVGYRVLSSQGTGCLGGVVRHGVIRLSLVNASHLYFIWFLRTATPDISTGMNSGVTISYPAGVRIWQLQQAIQVFLMHRQSASQLLLPFPTSPGCSHEEVLLLPQSSPWLPSTKHASTLRLRCRQSVRVVRSKFGSGFLHDQTLAVDRYDMRPFNAFHDQVSNIHPPQIGFEQQKVELAPKLQLSRLCTLGERPWQILQKR